ncbi:hypothetical protein J1N35_038494 [Gossypium stocksii]|uniref:Purple acid phosphatase C-terminal domain-containing protein n=1 Tax=Gossypium stocksii TaxID=47602 RepID=A0A9D3UM02_9ROSI|nr:hypothetical protein J1N35_038494 [Gossypium stocksii]
MDEIKLGDSGTGLTACVGKLKVLDHQWIQVFFEPPELFILNIVMHNLLSIVSISVQSLVYFMEGRLMLFSSEFSVSNLKYKVQLSSGERYPILDKSTPVYITVGDGGNQEDPQPEYSVFREASYSHSTLEIQNMTHRKVIELQRKRAKKKKKKSKDMVLQIRQI